MNCMLAESWNEKIDPSGYWMSEKMDGVRGIWDGRDFYSRQGHIFDAVPVWFKNDMPKNVVLDGELWYDRGEFQKCVSIVRNSKHVSEEDWGDMVYLVFDSPDLHMLFEERIEWLKKKLKHCKYAKLVEQTMCKSYEHMEKELKKILDKGGEGLMLREPKSEYVGKRTKILLKVKKFNDTEAKVIAYKEGTGRLKGMMGGLYCELNDGNKFIVGSGFTDAQRLKPPKIGAIITIKYQDLTKGGKPRCPVFLRERKKGL